MKQIYRKNSTEIRTRSSNLSRDIYEMKLCLFRNYMVLNSGGPNKIDFAVYQYWYLDTRQFLCNRQQFLS